MTDLSSIPGAGELVGKGVYCGLPENIPEPVRDRNAFVTGDADDCADAARQLGQAGWKVTVVTRASEVVCATGVVYLEALVLRRVHSRRIEACNASALFIL
jgi:hypothetical protein